MAGPEFKREIIIEGVDIGHSRLIDLFKLADLAEPYYQWVEDLFRSVLGTSSSLGTILLDAKHSDLRKAIRIVFERSLQSVSPVPKLFDGVGREYEPMKACYLFFSWLCRDAAQQRLEPIVVRVFQKRKAKTKRDKAEILADIFARLIVEYRGLLRSFEWTVLREVLVDRLEGSRRSIKGHEKEAIVRTAVLAAVQKYFARNKNYGSYLDAKIPETQVTLDGETFDVAVQLFNSKGGFERMILIPVKTRETEGGGHSHIFTRDINSAIDASKQGKNHFVIAVIVAQNWSANEQDHVRNITDLALFMKQNPNDFHELPNQLQEQLDSFIAGVLDGSIVSKTWESIRGLVQL